MRGSREAPRRSVMQRETYSERTVVVTLITGVVQMHLVMDSRRLPSASRDHQRRSVETNAATVDQKSITVIALRRSSAPHDVFHSARGGSSSPWLDGHSCSLTLSSSR
jgi:hypothetical protein